jgi:molybdate transport system ATP-binding protein
VFDLLGDLEFAAGLGQPAYGAAIAATVAQHRDGLTVLEFSGGELFVAKLDKPVGAHLRVRIRAEDVMLAREEPRAISANNVLAATVAAIHEGPGGQADVQLDCGGAKLVARITRASLARLQIAPDVTLFAIVKSVTVDPRILPAPEI